MVNTTTDLHVCLRCKHLHGRTISVDGLLIEDGKILLIKRKNRPYKGYWALPGGYIDFDETAEEACIREFREETGIHVAVVKLVGLFSAPSRHRHQNISAAYLVEKISGKKQAGDDALEVVWFKLDNLPKKLAFDHREIIENIKNLTQGREYY